MKRQTFKIISLWFLRGLMIFSAGCGCAKEIDVTKLKTGMIHAGDINIAYKTFGKGYPIVLIMGFSGTMDLWSPVVLGELASHYRVIIFDNRGMGYSDDSDREFSIELFADDTARLMEALKINKAHVLGWSMGTCVAQELTLRHPEKVNKLILYAADCGGKEAIQPTPDVIRAMIDESGTERERQMKALRTLFPEQWLKDNPDPRKYFPHPKETTSTTNIQRQWKANEAWTGSYSRLPQITQPTLLITGSEDVNTPTLNSLILAQKIPGAWLVQIKGGGHGLMYQWPKKFSKIVLEFLED
ncbi:MAG: alpha/beta hydrolase [Syntrophales bacterium]